MVEIIQGAASLLVLLHRHRKEFTTEQIERLSALLNELIQVAKGRK